MDSICQYFLAAMRNFSETGFQFSSLDISSSGLFRFSLIQNEIVLLNSRKKAGKFYYDMGPCYITTPLVARPCFRLQKLHGYDKKFVHSSVSLEALAVGFSAILVRSFLGHGAGHRTLHRDHSTQ